MQADKALRSVPPLWYRDSYTQIKLLFTLERIEMMSPY
jgi:hypothetical protein